MPNRDLQRNGAAVAEAEKIGPRDLQVLKQPGHVVGRLLERDRLAAIDVRPCPCSSSAMTRRLRARNGSTRPKFESIVEPPP